MRTAKKAQCEILAYLEADMKLRPVDMARMLGLNYQRYLDFRSEKKPLKDYHKALVLSVCYMKDSDRKLLKYDSDDWDGGIREFLHPEV